MPDLVIYIYMRMIPLSLPLKWLLSVSKLLRGYPLWFDNSFDFVLESMMSGMDLAPVQRLLYHILHPPKFLEMPPKNTTMFVWSFSHPMWLGILWSRPAPAWKSFLSESSAKKWSIAQHTVSATVAKYLDPTPHCFIPPVPPCNGPRLDFFGTNTQQWKNSWRYLENILIKMYGAWVGTPHAMWLKVIATCAIPRSLCTVHAHTS